MGKETHKRNLGLKLAYFTVSLFCFLLYVSYPQHTQAQDSIDGYELPDILDSEASKPIADPSAKPQQTYKPSQKIPDSDAVNATRAFSLIQNKAKPLPTPTASFDIYVPKPIKRPDRERKQIIEEVYKLTEAIQTHHSTIPVPLKRPAGLALNKPKKQVKRTAKQNNELVMPAVPAGNVDAIPLAQPTLQIEADDDINNITNISVAMNIEDDEQVEAIDVIDVINSPEENAEAQEDTAPIDTTAHGTSILIFNHGDTELSQELKAEIDSDILPSLNTHKDARIEIRSFAEPIDDTPSSARRLSLSRALAVRTYLLSKKVESFRMDVRALGSNTDKLPIDRIEIELIP